MAKAKTVGAPAWIVTFADLMSLLVCFFVLIISFSVPDKEKLKIAAGSIRDAFGFTREIVVTGVVELDGNPRFKFAKDLQPLEQEVIGPIPDTGRDISNLAAREDYFEELLDDQEQEAEDGPPLTEGKTFERIEEELRAAILITPELKELAENLHIERTPEGLRIQILDQARMSMFPLGSAAMYEPTRKLLARVAKAVEGLPNQIEIAGHTDGYGFRSRRDYDNWSLSLDRANATRKVLLANGLEAARIDAVIGRADTDHIVPDNAWDPRNRRISIMLLREQPAPSPDDGAGAAARREARALARAAEAAERDRGRGSLYSIAPRF